MKTRLRAGSHEAKAQHPVVLAPAMRQALNVLLWAERAVFFAIGLLLFGAALALLMASGRTLIAMFVGSADGTPMIALGSQFLDVTLLVLMIVELAYTVILSLRGAVLLAEPFLIVGLIAVIRRMLVITVGEVNYGKVVGTTPNGVTNSALELAILTGVVLAFVVSIFILRRQPKPEGAEFSDEALLE